MTRGRKKGGVNTTNTVPLKISKWAHNQVINSGYNIQELFDVLIDLVLSEEMGQFMYDYQIEFLQRRINECTMRIADLREEIFRTENEKFLLEVRHNELKDEYTKANKSIEMVSLIRTLNHLIVQSDFDEVSMGVNPDYRETVKRIKELNSSFDIRSHIRTLKSIL